MPDTTSKATDAPIKLERIKQIPLSSAVLALDPFRDGKRAMVACQDGGVFEVELESGRVDRVGGHESYASGVKILPDQGTVISAGYDGVLQWHSVHERRCLRSVKAHQFWSWGMDLSPDGSLVASVTGRYEAGGYRYEPAPEREPSVKVFDTKTGELRQSLEHLPPVQAVAFSPDGSHLAAGNLMGEVRVWQIATGKRVAQWTTPDFTSWGIIKSHHYLGGVFSMMFSPNGEELYLCGMGPMRDPMAGNGVQRWQRFSWREGKKLDETHEGESGQGLMEAITFHPSHRQFVMAGRLFQGQWNLAVFDTASGKNLHAIDAKHRVTDLRFVDGGNRLLIAKAKQQERRKDGQWAPYGALEIHSIVGLGS